MATRRAWAWLAGALAIAGLAFVGIGYWHAVSAPVVRELTVRSPDYPANANPTRIVLLSDVHEHGPDMPPERVARIVAQVNALKPDLVIMAGDFIGDNWVGSQYPIGAAIAPFRDIRARLGTYAVLGNNDYDAGGSAVARSLEDAGVHVLINQAAQAGPIALGGIDGNINIPRSFWKTRRNATFAALRATPGMKVLVAHRPDEFESAPSWIDLVLAGHTHCGQVVLPLIGALETGSDFGQKYLCGVIRKGAKTLVVTAGVGTSHLPLRIGAPPDMWLIDVRRGPRTSM